MEIVVLWFPGFCLRLVLAGFGVKAVALVSVVSLGRMAHSYIP